MAIALATSSPLNHDDDEDDGGGGGGGGGGDGADAGDGDDDHDRDYLHGHLTIADSAMVIVFDHIVMPRITSSCSNTTSLKRPSGPRCRDKTGDPETASWDLILSVTSKKSSSLNPKP